MNWLIGTFAAFIIVTVSFRFRFLTTSGAIGAFVIGSAIFGLGGLPFSIPLVLFFVSSSLLSKIGKPEKSRLNHFTQKGSQRDLAQVLANGLIPTVLLIIWSLTKQAEWIILYLTAIAAATADTWATEIGVLSKARPRSIVTFKKVVRGTSGGITITGTLAAFFGGLSIAICGTALFLFDTQQTIWSSVLIISVAAFAGQFVDSFLGAVLQAKYRCPVCDEPTETRTHCGTNAVHVSGWRFLDNDLVNLISVWIAVVLAFFILYLT